MSFWPLLGRFYVMLSGRAESFKRAFGVFLRSLAVLQGRAPLFGVFGVLWRCYRAAPHSPAGVGGLIVPSITMFSTDVV